MQDVPKIAYGMGTAWYKSVPGATNRKLVDAIKVAIQVGYTHLDAAQVYNNEEECGIALQESGVPRDSLWITTKLSQSNFQNPLGALKESLRKLGLSRVDLYLIHTPFSDDNHQGTLEDCWAGMEQCQYQGLTRYIGVSNFRVKDLNRILKVASIPVYANQIEMHPYNAQPDLHKLMQKHNIIGMSYAPLAPLVHKPDGPLSPLLRTLSKKYNKTEGQILLRWNLQQGNIVVTTSGKFTRMSEQLEILSFSLTDEDDREVSRVGNSLRYRKYFVDELEADSQETRKSET